MMSRKELLHLQQSMLQRSLAYGRNDIRFMMYHPYAKETYTDAEKKSCLKTLHREQYAETKLLKMVENEIRLDAMSKKAVKVVVSYKEEQND